MSALMNSSPSLASAPTLRQKNKKEKEREKDKRWGEEERERENHKAHKRQAGKFRTVFGIYRFQ